MASECTSHALNGFIPFNAPANADKLKAVARIELGETEERKTECLQQLRQLIKDNNLKCITREDFLLRFLRVKKFHVQRSFESLRLHASQRVTFHKRLLRLQPETLKTFLDLKIFSILPYRDTESRLLFFHKSEFWNLDIISEEESVLFTYLFVSFLAEQESSQVTGAICTHDVEYFPLALIPFLLRNGSFGKSFVFDGMPVRYPAVHILNESVLVKYVLRIIEPFLPEKIKGRILLHGKSREVLFEHIPPAILPSDLGGSLGPLTNDHLVEEMIAYLKRIKDEQRYFI